MNRFQTAMVALLFTCALPVASLAVQIQVPSEYPTIQGAIAAAGSSDTVVVAPGTYYENVLIEGKSTCLVSHYLIDGNVDHIRKTIIDGSSPTHPDSASVIRLIDAGDALVQGFTITGGTGTLWRDQSDGLLYREGGGILTEGGTPRIYDNLIIDNSASNKVGARSAGGGGMRCGFGGVVDVRGNVIAYNTGRYGGGIVLFHASGTLKNNILYRNRGGEDFGGGGMWITSAGSNNLIENNTILENSSAVDGGGILVWVSTASMVGNIFWGNVALSKPQIGLRSGATASIVSYSNVEGGFAGTDNLAVPPEFFSTNFHLNALSPCVDAGDPASEHNDPADPLNGTLARAPAQGTLRNDMGAYGGPGMHDFPQFNAPGISAVPSLEYGTVLVAESSGRWLRCTKVDFGLVRVDSFQVLGDPLGTLRVETALPLSMGPAPEDTLDSLYVVWAPETYGELKDTLLLFHSDPSVANPLLVTVSGTAPGTTGDVNFDGVLNASDIIYMVNYAFKGGASPRPVPAAGDANCDGSVTSVDIIFLVNFVFKSGPGPCS